MDFFYLGFILLDTYCIVRNALLHTVSYHHQTNISALFSIRQVCSLLSGSTNIADQFQPILFSNQMHKTFLTSKQHAKRQNSRNFWKRKMFEKLRNNIPFHSAQIRPSIVSTHCINRSRENGHTQTMTMSQHWCKCFPFSYLWIKTFNIVQCHQSIATPYI